MKIASFTLLTGFALVVSAAPSRAQLLQSLRTFGNSVSLLDPSAAPSGTTYESDGPKELVTADFNLDGRPDLALSKVSGKVAVVYGLGGKDFVPARFLSPPPGTGELRGIASGDFNGDGRPDIATAAPYSGRVIVFYSGSGMTFAAPVTVNAWRGVRNLIAADLDGDGDQDILAAGPDGIASGWGSSVARVVPYYRNVGSFTAGTAQTLTGSTPWKDAFPRPVFTMSVLPPLAGSFAQRVVLTHALSDIFWISAWNAVSQQTTLAAAGPTLTFSHSLAAGRVLTRDGPPDLVIASRDANQVLVRRGTAAGGFEATVAQRLYLPGAPRAMAIADVDADGWNDLLVVLRNYDRVVTFRSEEGTLKLTAEAPTGTSPRDLATADFNGDGRPDLAIANRKSDNLSVLLTQPSSAGFEQLDTVYKVDGGVSALELKDLNGDGRADVILTHMQTHEISVRLAQPGGLLAAPEFTKVPEAPLTIETGDFDSDGRTDIIAVHNSRTKPGLSILKGRGDGSFAPPVFFSAGGGLFSIQTADFDRDGILDVAVGYYDCRLALYKGAADGTFSLRRQGLFTYEARAMVTGDFDQDGDTDLAGASAMGTMTVVNNNGHLLDVPASGTPHDLIFTRTVTTAGDKAGIKSMVILDANGDTDPDVAINSSSGVFVFTGGAGLSFTARQAPLPGTNSATDLTRGDMDGDGLQDLVTACRLLSCVVILKGLPDLTYEVAAVNPVPSADMIAAGDIDGDGKADLAGAGEVLWTALSSRAPQAVTGSGQSARPPFDGVVLNEMMSSNLTIPLDSNGRTPDFVELYNGKSTAMTLTGWQLRYQEKVLPPAPAPVLMTHVFPGGATLPSGGRMLLICDEDNLTDHVRFKLSKAGGTLTLVDSTGAVMDSLSWENQEPDVSLGRFSDGAGTWFTKTAPDPGQPNFIESSSGPRFNQVSLEPATLRAGNLPRLFVKASDDAGIFTLTAVWKWLNPSAAVPLSETTGQVGLFDDGMHGDGASLDGLFSAVMPATLPAGARIEFFVKATNLLDEEEVAPGDPLFALPGQEITNYSFAVPDTTTAAPGLEISEVQTHSAILDELAEPSDFIELRNTGTSAVLLSGMALRDGLYSAERTFSLSGSLAPGEHRFFYADSDQGQGALHLPFKLSNEGDSVWLVRLDAQGVPAILDKVSPPAREGSTDSWARLGPGGPFTFLSPTAGRSNLAAGVLHCEVLQPSAPGALRTFRLALSVPAGSTRTIESWTPGSAWQPAGQVAGNGLESFLDYPIAPSSKSRFFRAR